MAVFSVSFEIKYDSDYQRRYNSFTAAIEACPKWWADTTSYYVVETNESISDFADRIYFGTDFDASRDLYLVLDAFVKSGCIRGAVKNDNIFQLLPFLKKL
jgi:hypothetical protein